MQLIYVFVFAYAKSRFPHDAAQLYSKTGGNIGKQYFFFVFAPKHKLWIIVRTASQ